MFATFRSGIQRYFVAASISIAASIGGATAQDSVIWSDDVSGWTVAVDRSLNDGCFAFTCFDGGTCLRLQLNAANEQVIFFVMNNNWQSLETGKLYDIEVKFGTLTPWTGRASVHRFSDGLPSLVLNVPFEEDRALNFVDEFMRMTGVQISYSGSVIANLSLRGTYAAMEEVFNCQRTMIEGGRGTRSDPFSSAPQSSDDPFR